MDLALTPEEEAFGEEARRWLQANVEVPAGFRSLDEEFEWGLPSGASGGSVAIPPGERQRSLLTGGGLRNGHGERAWDWGTGERDDTTHRPDRAARRPRRVAQ